MQFLNTSRQFANLLIMYGFLRWIPRSPLHIIITTQKNNNYEPTFDSIESRFALLVLIWSDLFEWLKLDGTNTRHKKAFAYLFSIRKLLWTFFSRLIGHMPCRLPDFGKAEKNLSTRPCRSVTSSKNAFKTELVPRLCLSDAISNFSPTNNNSIFWIVEEKSVTTHFLARSPLTSPVLTEKDFFSFSHSPWTPSPQWSSRRNHLLNNRRWHPLVIFKICFRWCRAFSGWMVVFAVLIPKRLLWRWALVFVSKEKNDSELRFHRFNSRKLVKRSNTKHWFQSGVSSKKIPKNRIRKPEYPEWPLIFFVYRPRRCASSDVPPIRFFQKWQRGRLLISSFASITQMQFSRGPRVVQKFISS